MKSGPVLDDDDIERYVVEAEWMPEILGATTLTLPRDEILPIIGSHRARPVTKPRKVSRGV